MRRLLSIFIMSLGLLTTQALDAAPLDFGLDWGASASFLKVSHSNFNDDMGSRVDLKETRFGAYANGYVMARFGIYINDYVRMDVKSGFMGIEDGRRIVPVLIRANVMPSGYFSDGIVYFLDAGAGLHPGDIKSLSWLASAGAGYRKALCGKTGLNFLLNARFVTDNPPIRNADGGGYVPESSIRKNVAGYLSIGIGISLDF